jgi:hypothetical protein
MPFRSSRPLFIAFLFLLVGFSIMTGSAAAQVNYRLEGLVTVRSAVAKLTTPDGRVFKLAGISFIEVAKYDGANVLIEGSVKQADDLEVLNVKSIVKKPIDPTQVVLPPYKPRQRPAKLVSYRDGVMTVGNIRWGQKPNQALADPGMSEHFFKIIRLRPDLVENAYFVLKPFEPKLIAAHSLFIFTFKPGAIVTTTGEKSDGLILTIEAWQRQDQKYDLKQGLKNTFGSAWIMTSYEDYMEEIRLRKEELVLYPVNINREQTRKLVEECVKYASVNRQGEFYHTITNNCTNNLIVMLNRVLEKNRQIDMWWLPNMAYNMRATLPVAVPKYLIKKGILKNNIRKIDHTNAHLPLQKHGL